MSAIFLFFTLIGGFICQYLGLPLLTGYLAAGFALSTLDYSGSALLSNIADFGISTLLFCIGLHLRPKSFFSYEVLGVGLLHLSIFSLLAFAGLSFLNLSSWPLAIALALSSTIATAKIFEDRGEIDSFQSRVALGILILQDIVAVGILVTFGSYSFGSQSYVLLIVPLCIPVLRVSVKYCRSPEILLLFGVCSCLVFAELFKYAGISGHLGALIGGAALAGLGKAEELYQKILSIKEILLVGVFLEIGLYGLPHFESFWIFFLLGSLLVFKFVLFFILLCLFRLRARTAFVTALSLSAYSEFLLVIASFLVKNQALDQEMLTTMAFVTAISFVISGIFTLDSGSLWTRFATVLRYFQREGRLVDRRPSSLGSATVLVLGMGAAGTAAYDRLVELGVRPVGIENDPERVSQALAKDRRVLFADAQDATFWQGVDLAELKTIFLMMPNYEAKRVALEKIRSLGFAGTFAALARTQEGHQELEKLGVKTVGLPMVEVGRELAELVLRPS